MCRGGGDEERSSRIEIYAEETKGFPEGSPQHKERVYTAMPRNTQPTSLYQGAARRKRLSPLMIIGISVPLLLLLIGGFVFIFPRLASHAAADNMNCSLIVPANPLSAQGLATPYQLVATDPAAGPCHEANKVQAAFVQGAVINTVTGRISVYNPLVIDQGTQPAANPVTPKLPAQSVVALWFGFNGNNLTLQDNNGSLAQGKCINGIAGSIFGQFAYCNAPRFFQAANRAMRVGQLVPPALGMANDGKPCPTVRDFSVVDMDQSDNVTTTYLINANGQTAQMTAANITALQNTQTQANASDNRLLAVAMDGALGCTPWMAPDLADPGHTVPALPLNELQAGARQGAPMATVPANDPMVLNNNNTDLNKLNAYRRGVDQPPVGSLNNASTTTYCQNLVKISPARMQLDSQVTAARPSPDPAAANSLFTFLAQRFVATFGANGLNCQQLLNMQDPITVTTDGNGVATQATINANAGGGNGGGGNGGGNQAINCSVNGTVVANCTGTTTINGQTCTLAVDQANHQVVITCPAQNQGQGQQNGGQQNGGQQNNGQQNNGQQNGGQQNGGQQAQPTATPAQ